MTGEQSRLNPMPIREAFPICSLGKSLKVVQISGETAAAH